MKKIKIRKKKKEEKVKKKGRIKSIILSTILILGITLISFILVFALYIIITSPDFDKEKLYSKESSVLYYNDGVTELARVGSADRVLVSYDELPQVLIDAIVATEDSRFFQHSGLDVARFLKASFKQLLGDDTAGGASTITMQVIKQTYTNSESQGIKGIIRKFTDIYMAVFKLESNYTKEEILEFYVNAQWFGNNGNQYYASINGVEQACQYYFGKSVKDISLAEASLIAGLFQSPSKKNPYYYPEAARARQKIVLKLMVQHGYITQEEMDAVLEIPIESLIKESAISKSSSQAVIDYVLDEVETDTGYDPSTTAMKIVTTIDKSTQDVLNSLEDGEIYTFINDYIQEGIAITSVEDGSIVAMSGGRNYTAKGTNRALTKRQIGSTAKPIFDYGPYIEYLNGSPATLFLDMPTTYSNGTSIKNSDGSYMGLITMRTALVQSRNIPALEAFKAVYAENPDYIADFVHGLGIDYGDELLESYAIGGLETGASPLQMSAAYAAFGRGGYYIEPYSYTSATLVETGETFEQKPEKVKVMSEETAYMITDMLLSASSAGVGGVKVSGVDIAAKSGTTNLDDATTSSLGIPSSATRDAWNITYSPQYSIALWVGYDKNTSEYYLDATTGGKIRNAIMKAVGSRVYGNSTNKTFSTPSGIISVEVESETIPAELPSEYTPSNLRMTDIFKEGTEPTTVSTRFSKLSAPTNGKATTDGDSVKLTWTAIKTPDAINTTYLANYFNENYSVAPTTYYENRIAYNNAYVGTLGYQIYEKNKDGTLTYIGRTENSYYTVVPTSSGKVTYVIKSAYSIFQSNMSDGLEITFNVTITDDDDDDDIINNKEEENKTTTNNNKSSTDSDDDLD